MSTSMLDFSSDLELLQLMFTVVVCEIDDGDFGLAARVPQSDLVGLTD